MDFFHLYMIKGEHKNNIPAQCSYRVSDVLLCGYICSNNFITLANFRTNEYNNLRCKEFESRI